MLEALLEPLVEIPCYVLGRFTAKYFFPSIKVAECDLKRHARKLKKLKWSFAFTYELNGDVYFKDYALTLLGFMEISLLIVFFIMVY